MKDEGIKSCGFNTGAKIKVCTEECRYFDTCTRNPHTAAGLKNAAAGSSTGKEKGEF